MTGTTLIGDLLRRGGGFAFNMFIVAGSSLVAIPLVIGLAGGNVWAAVTVAQTVGALAAILVAFGWGVLGPATVAKMHADADQRQYFTDSLAARAYLFALTAVPMALVVEHVRTPGISTLTALFAA